MKKNLVICTTALTLFAALALPLQLAAQEGPSAQEPTAPTFAVLYTFTGGTDGKNPYADLIRDSAGNLYGTSQYGGAFNYGNVFKLDTAGKEIVLHSFADGGDPYAGLVRDRAGDLYGATYNQGPGYGNVFKLDTAGKEIVLHSFTQGADGGNPYGGLLRDSAGNLYGTTEYGGAYGYGTVFELDKTGKETVLHNFDYSDGENPFARLVRDPAGNLYGTTSAGGIGNCVFGCGVIFKVDTAGKATVLHSFTGGVDGGAIVGRFGARWCRQSLRHRFRGRCFRQWSGVQARYDRQGEGAA